MSMKEVRAIMKRESAEFKERQAKRLAELREKFGGYSRDTSKFCKTTGDLVKKMIDNYGLEHTLRQVKLLAGVNDDAPAPAKKRGGKKGKGK